MSYTDHPLLKKGSLQSRVYQETILARAVGKNLLCVLPTGLGKTPIAIVLSVFRLERHPGSKVLVLAPTKPLIEQHRKSFSEKIDLPEKDFVLVTGMVKPGDREDMYERGKIIFATPQTVRNDLEKERISLRDFSLVVFDEAHHAVGEYAYPFIARHYLDQSENPRILGLTASPGGTRQKIREICKNLGIDSVEIKTESDLDVSPWVKEKDVEWVEVSLPETFVNIRDYLEKPYRDRLNKLRRIGFSKPVRLINKRDLLGLQNRLMEGLRRGDRRNFYGITVVTQAIKLEHAITLLETQGIRPLEEYFRKLRKETSKSTKGLLNDQKVSHAMFLSNGLSEKGAKHPKMSKLCEIISRQMEKKGDSKIIVFANYRNTVREIVKSLKGIGNAKPVEFMGQREGMTQKEQKQRIEEFRLDIYNVLVTTSVGEEGIDIPEMELAVFYEPVPSEIRSIQRRGRVGRTKFGRIIILMTKNTRDEAYYWTAMRKEKVMKDTLHEMRSELEYPTDGMPTMEDMERKERKQLRIHEF